MKLLAIILIIGSGWVLFQAVQMSDDASRGLIKFGQQGIMYICMSMELLMGALVVIIIDLFLKDNQEK